MKLVQKLVLPLLLIAVIVLIYITYFSPKEGLGSFSDFDANNTANKDIKVRVLSEKGVKKDAQNGVTSFYVVDNNGTEVLVQAPLDVPGDIQSAEKIILKGHLHPDHFHAVEVQIE
jgi:cytochrome c-type biogenesis protein CcmE